MGCSTEKEEGIVEDVNPFYMGYLEANNGNHLWEAKEGHDQELEGIWILDGGPAEGIVFYPNGTFFHFYTIEDRLHYRVGEYRSEEENLYLVFTNRNPNNQYSITDKSKYTIEGGDTTRLNLSIFSKQFEKQESKGGPQ